MLILRAPHRKERHTISLVPVLWASRKKRRSTAFTRRTWRFLMGWKKDRFLAVAEACYLTMTDCCCISFGDSGAWRTKEKSISTLWLRSHELFRSILVRVLTAHTQCNLFCDHCDGLSSCTFSTSSGFRDSEYCVRRIAHENVSQGLKTLDPFQSPDLIEEPVRIVISITSTRSEDLTNCCDHVNMVRVTSISFAYTTCPISVFAGAARTKYDVSGF